MISRLLYALEAGVRSLAHHPQIVFALLLVIVLPLAFLYSGNQFLEAGKAYQDRLQKDRVGILHDSFVMLLDATEYDADAISMQLRSVAEINPDITKFRVAKLEKGEIIPIAALSDEILGVPEEEKVLYQNATVRVDESIIFEFFVDGERMWQAFRAISTETGDIYFVMNEFSLAGPDVLLQSRMNVAYLTLGIIYLLVLGIAYWLVRITNYRYLYTKAQQAIETKDLFTNMIAHELRAPLTAIRGYASMITEDTNIDSENKKYASRVHDSSERLLAIVNDLLDVARIQSGKLTIEKKLIDISNIIVAVTEELEPSAQQKHIELVHTGTDNSHTAQIDPKRMHQAITNLVSNAIKYTKEGKIEVAIEEKSKVVEIRVKDTGMGISAEDQQKLFAPFFRVDSSDVSQITGTGLGMWITRQLIELMGASIGVESIKGVGTHIVVSIPNYQVKK